MQRKTCFVERLINFLLKIYAGYAASDTMQFLYVLKDAAMLMIEQGTVKQLHTKKGETHSILININSIQVSKLLYKVNDGKRLV